MISEGSRDTEDWGRLIATEITFYHANDIYNIL